MLQFRSFQHPYGLFLGAVASSTESNNAHLRGLIFSFNHLAGSSSGGMCRGLPFQTRIIEMTRNTLLTSQNTPAPVDLPEKAPAKVNNVLIPVIPICSARPWAA